jgi:hypothetical protein
MFRSLRPTVYQKAKRMEHMMEHINHCIQALKEQTESRPKTEYAAVWVPDKASSNCMACKRSNFTVLNIRRHCRNCGAIVCGACSQNKSLIWNQCSKSVRVCNVCYKTWVKSLANLEENTALTQNLVDLSKDGESAANSSYYDWVINFSEPFSSFGTIRRLDSYR